LIKIFFKNFDTSFENRINYVLEFIEQHPLVEKKLKFSRDANLDFDIQCNYGISEKSGFLIPSQQLIFSASPNKNFYKLIANCYSSQSTDLYSVESVSKESTTFIEKKEFKFDLIETIFFHISRIEEWSCEDTQLDQWDCMRSEEQFLVKNQLHQIPVVDRIVYAFSKALGVQHTSSNSLFKITHDIDAITYKPTLFSSLRASIGILIRGQGWTPVIRIWISYLTNGKNRYDTFDWLLSDSSALEKNIYFLVDGATEYDTPFDLRTERMKTIFLLCQERNYKIGIHPSYNCWKDEKMLQNEKEKLENLINDTIDISRQHYLHFDFKTTPKILDHLAIKEDSTLGFNDRIGFRCGTGFGYHLYDFENERPFKFIETPLVFMDSSLLNETNYDLEKTTQLWRSFLDKNKLYTKITFNFHNTRFHDAKIHGIPLKKWYLALLSSTNHDAVDHSNAAS